MATAVKKKNKCPKCGEETTDKADSCSSCGASLKSVSRSSATRKSYSVELRRLTPEHYIVLAASALLVVLTLTYLITYFVGDGEFNLLAFAMIAFFFSSGLPLYVTLMSSKNAALLKLNYCYAGLIWLMQLGEVSLMKGTWTWAGAGFFRGLDFWIVMAASGIGAGTYFLESRASQGKGKARHRRQTA